MITVSNVRNHAMYFKGQTVVLFNPRNLRPEEVATLERITPKGISDRYLRWISSRGSYDLNILDNGKVVFICATNEKGNYDYYSLQNSFAGLFSAEGYPSLTKNDILILGLPGLDEKQREKSRTDITRWFSKTDNNVTILCYESDD